MSLNQFLTGIFETTSQPAISLTDFFLCIGTSLIIGLLLAFVYTYKSRYTKSFVITLAMIPAVVCMVIMMVNGNLGAGVAVAGTFSLVRFRSVPGTAKEIGAIFLAMGTGLATGMGYLGYAILFAFTLGIANLVYVQIGLGGSNGKKALRTMRITIPEDLDFTGVFEEVLGRYASEWELVGVKTTNMGSLFKLTYNLTLKDSSLEKIFIDELRCRNGNLEISCSKQETALNEL